LECWWRPARPYQGYFPGAQFVLFSAGGGDTVELGIPAYGSWRKGKRSFVPMDRGAGWPARSRPVSRGRIAGVARRTEIAGADSAQGSRDDSVRHGLAGKTRASPSRTAVWLVVERLIGRDHRRERPMSSALGLKDWRGERLRRVGVAGAWPRQNGGFQVNDLRKPAGIGMALNR